MKGDIRTSYRGVETEKKALELLGLKWKKEPEPCHDYLQFLTRRPDNLRLATASSDYHVDQVTEIWDLPDRKMLYRLQTPNSKTMVLAWLMNDAFMTGGQDCILTLWQDDHVVKR